MLVAMTVMLIVLAAAFSMLNVSLKASAQTYEVADAQQGLRISHDFINRDLISAGDGFFAVSTITVPNKFISTYITHRPSSEFDADGDGMGNMLLVMSDNVDSAGATVPTQSGDSIRLMPNSDRMTTMTVDRRFIPVEAWQPSSNGQLSVPVAASDSFQIGDLYYVSNGITSTFVVLTNKSTTIQGDTDLHFEEGDVLGLNNLEAQSPLLKVIGNRYFGHSLIIARANIIQYFAGENGTLYRRLFGGQGNLFVDGLIAENLTRCNFLYYLDKRTGNAMSAPISKIPQVGAYIPVRVVQADITVKSVNPDPQGNPRTVSAVSAVSVRNLQFRESGNMFEIKTPRSTS